MKRILIIAAVVFAGIGLAAIPCASLAQSLPACSLDGDKDGDGILDADDSDETDSCLESNSGLEDCSTGAGDGVPDCQ
jgi:hypothetical protein